MIQCENPACELVFEPVATRWLCPRCKQKADCCSGEPQPLSDTGPTFPVWT